MIWSSSFKLKGDSTLKQRKKQKQSCALTCAIVDFYKVYARNCSQWLPQKCRWWTDFLLFLIYFSEPLDCIFLNHILFFFNKKLTQTVWQEKRLFGPWHLCIQLTAGKSLDQITFPVSSGSLSHTSLTHQSRQSLKWLPSTKEQIWDFIVQTGCETQGAFWV